MIRAELPGIDPEKDVEVTVADGVLTIKAHREDTSHGVCGGVIVATLTDQHIQTAVEVELRWTPDIESAHIGVSSENHSVTLTGTVGSFAERTASRRAAFRVQGVSAVNSQGKRT